MRSSLQLATIRSILRSAFPHSVVAAAAAAAEERLVKNVQTTLISNVEVKNDGEFFALKRTSARRATSSSFRWDESLSGAEAANALIPEEANREDAKMFLRRRSESGERDDAQSVRDNL